MSSNFERTLDVLLDTAVLQEDEDELVITDAFTERVSDRDVPTSVDELETVTNGLLDSDEVASLAIVGDRSPQSIARYLTIVEYCEDALSKAERAWVTMTLEWLPPDPAPDDGTPPFFTPVHANKIPFVAQFFGKSIVYIWREDCPPCDTVRSDFEELFDEPPEEFALFSTYGPDASELLLEEYSVRGGPTTLFFLDGDVDLRLIGAPYQSVLEKEIDKFRDM